MVVLWKHKIEFTVRTLVQPFFLCFVFLYVFPKIGQGIGAASGIPGAESAFATVLVPGVVGLSIMFQGIQAVAMQLAQEFGFTREIEDRVQAPCPIWLVAISKVISGGAQGLISAAIVLPIASVVHAAGVEAQINLHWLLILTLVPLSCVCMASLGLLLGNVLRAAQPRASCSGSSCCPITFLGGTYYQWTRLAPVKAGSVHWLQIVVLINPLIYINDGMRAAFTDAAHMHLYIIYPAIAGVQRHLPGTWAPQLPRQGARLTRLGSPAAQRGHRRPGHRRRNRTRRTPNRPRHQGFRPRGEMSGKRARSEPHLGRVIRKPCSQRVRTAQGGVAKGRT